MNYKNCIDWLNSFEQFGIKLGLNRIRYICKKLGNPQDCYNIIHVGGTNGKGSVCKYLESILVNNGYSVGTYTSPHLQRITERFIVNKKEISKKEIISLIVKIKPIIKEMVNNNNSPTYFEIVTAIAFQYFKEKKVDFSIIEVGLGGRFDATNIINPMVTIITNVTLEHQNILGEKIEKISLEKAGIIKKDIPLITAATGKGLNILKKVASDNNSPITIISENSFKIINKSLNLQEYQVIGSIRKYNIKTSMIGNYQVENIAITIAAIETLQMNGLYLTDDSINESFLNTKNPGRMEIAGLNPLILLDGAHNVAAMKLLKKFLQENFSNNKIILIIGILSDKNVQSILDIITCVADLIIVTRSQNKRSFEPNKLKKMIRNNEVIVKDNVINAIKYVNSVAEKDDIICITGSLYIVGESREHLKKKIPKM
jgi:dihydrofolate synthase/folylpolyglutamate synthase